MNDTGKTDATSFKRAAELPAASWAMVAIIATSSAFGLQVLAAIMADILAMIVRRLSHGAVSPRWGRAVAGLAPDGRYPAVGRDHLRTHDDARKEAIEFLEAHYLLMLPANRDEKVVLLL